MGGINSFEVTGYIMCCLEPFSINDSLSTEKVTPTLPEDTEEEIDQVYDVIARSFEPILYDRNRGWDGSTYDEAVQFCSKSSAARVLCPVEVYCPDGNVPMSIPGGSNIWELMEENGDNVNNEHWAPLGEAQNGWIQIGWHEGQTCKTHEQLSGMDPSWGVSGIDSFEVTGYIMCCVDPSSSINDSLSTEKVTPTLPREEVIDQVYDVIARSFEPILYDRNRGWDG